MNNIVYKLGRITMLLVSSLLFITCIDFEDINKPNTPNSDETKGDYFYIGVHFKKLQESVILTQQNAYQFNENLTGQPYARYMTITQPGWNQTNFCVFNASDSWLNSTYNDQMVAVYPTWFELKKILGEEDKLNHFTWAWAEILRVAAVHRTTDMYGPLPYSEIKKNTGETRIAFDSQEDVYKGLLEDLNKAIDILTPYVLAGGDSEYSAFKNYDMVYGGKFEQWVKFANSLKLRMAMRMVYVDQAAAKMHAEAAISHPIGVITSNGDNAAIKTSNSNPLFIMWGAYGDTRACAEMMSHLKGYNDPRIGKYFQKSSNKVGEDYTGMRFGIAISNIEWARAFSSPNAGGNDPVMWLSAAEVAFSKAEAAAIWNWNVGGDTAEDLYNEGIRLSFEQWGAGSADSYLADNVLTPAAFSDDGNGVSAASSITIAWDNSASNEVKQERILTQKWLALYPLGLEAWAEHRRTGYPRFFPSIVVHNTDGTLKTRGASRIPYGPMEAQSNRENYDKAVILLGGADAYGTRLWWDKKSGKPNW